MSLTISAGQVATLIANPSSISGYSSSGPIIITGNITYTQADNLNAVDATYIQATVTETTVANLGTITVDNSSRTELNKFTFTVSDTAATAAELNTAQAKTSVTVDASNVSSIESSPATDLASLYTGTTPTGIDDADIAVNDSTISASDYIAIDGYTTGTATFAATTIEGAAADINTALSGADADVIHEDDIAVTVTDTTVSAEDLVAIEGLTTGVTSVTSATSMTGSHSDVDAAFGFNDDEVNGGDDPERINGLDNINVTLTDDPTLAEIVEIIAQTGTGKVTATAPSNATSLANYIDAGISGTGHIITIPTLVNTTIAAADLVTLDTATTETITFVPSNDADSPTISESSYSNVLSVLTSTTISGLDDSPVTVSGTISVDEANAIDAETTGVITASISDNVSSTLAGLTGTGNAYTITIGTSEVEAADLNAIDSATTETVTATAVTLVSGSLTDTSTLYANAANFTDLGAEDVTVTSTTIDADLLSALVGDTSELVTISGTVTAVTGEVANIEDMYTANAAGTALTGLDTDATVTVSGDSNNVVVAADLNTINGFVSTVVQIDSSVTTLQGDHDVVELSLIQNKTADDDTGVETPTISGLDNLDLVIDDSITTDELIALQTNYTLGTIQTSLDATTIGALINETNGVNDVASGDNFSVTVTDQNINAEELVELNGMTTGLITVDYNNGGVSTIDGSIADIKALYAAKATTGNGIAGIGDAIITLDDTDATVAAADLKILLNETTGTTADITLGADVTRITGLIADVNTVLADEALNSEDDGGANTNAVTITDASVDAEAIATLLADGAQLTSGDVTFISSSMFGTATEIDDILSTGGLIDEHATDNTADVFGLDSIDLTVEGTPTAEVVRGISALTDGIVTATIINSEAMSDLLDSNTGLDEAISSSFAGHNLTITLQDSIVQSSDLETLATKTSGTITLDTDATTTDIDGTSIQGTITSISAVFGESKISGEEAAAVTITGGASVSQINDLNTSGLITATVTDGDMTTLAGITETTNALSITVTDSSVDASALVALTGRTTGLVNVESTSTLTGTLDEVTAALEATATINGVEDMANVTVSDSITVAQAQDLHDLTNGSISATITETDLDTLGGLDTGHAWIITVDKQTEEDPDTDGDQLVTTLTASELTDLDTKTSAVVTVTAPAIEGTYAEVTAAFDANTPADLADRTISGLETAAITISDASITQSELELAQDFSSGVLTATISQDDILTVDDTAEGDKDRILSFDAVAANANYAPGEYTGLTGTITSDNGADAELTIDVADAGDGTGGAITVTITNPGSGFVAADTIVIAETDLGYDAGDGSDDLTLTVATLGYGRTADTYEDVAATGGTGSGVTFDVVVASDGSITSVTVNSSNGGGGGYTIDDTLTIANSVLGNATGGQDITVDVATIGNVSIADFLNETDGATDVESGNALAVTFDDATIAASDLIAANNLTSGLITLNNPTLTGTLSDLTSVYAAAVATGDGILTTGFDTSAITIQEPETFGGLISAADLNALDALTDGVITIDTAWDADGQDDGDDTTITGITGSYSDVHDALTADKQQANSSDTTGSETPSIVLPNDLTVTLTGSSTVAQVNDIAGYSVGAITATVTETDMATLDDLDGGDTAVAATAGTGFTAVANATIGSENGGDLVADTYTNVSTTSDGSGRGATFDVVVSAADTIDSITLNTAGVGYAVGDTITLDTTVLGDGASISFAVLALAASTLNAYTVTVDDTSVAAANLNTLDGKTSETITVNSTTITGALAANGAVDTALSSAGLSDLSAIAVTSDDNTNTVTEVNNISSQTTGVVTATLADGLLSTFGSINETGNAYSITITDTGSIDAATVNVLNGKTTAQIDLTTATSITGALSDIKTLYDANTDEEVTGLGNESITVSDTGSISSQDLNDLNDLTTGVVTVTALTEISGALADIVDTYSTNNLSGVITGLSDEDITITDTGSVSAADLVAITTAATGTTGTVTANDVTAVSGSYSDITSAYAAGIEGLGDEAITSTSSVTVAEANALNLLTDGVVTATISTEDIDALDDLTGTGNAYTITVADASVSAAKLTALNAKTTVDVIVSSATVTGTATEIDAAYDASGFTGLGSEALTVNSGTASVSEVNALGEHTEGVVTATVTEGDMTTLAGITETGNALSVTVTDTSVSATALTALDGKTTAAVDASGVTTLTGTDTEQLAAYAAHRDGTITGLDSSFDAASYLASHSDLLRTYTKASVKSYFFDFGIAEGRALDTFDEATYLASYTDLLDYFGTDTSDVTTHYVDFGYGEGRSTDAFDELGYIASYADLIEYIGVDASTAVTHYINFGYGEGRSVTFDAESYLDANADLKAFIQDDLELAKKHYILHGADEGRLLA